MVLVLMVLLMMVLEYMVEVVLEEVLVEQVVKVVFVLFGGVLIVLRGHFQVQT